MKRLHSERVEKMHKLHSKRVEKMHKLHSIGVFFLDGDCLNDEALTTMPKEAQPLFCSEGTSGEDVNLHSKRVKKM